MANQKNSKRLLIGVVIVVALLSMACGLSLQTPNFNQPNFGRPTKAPTIDLGKQPTLDTSGTAVPTSPPSGGGAEQTTSTPPAGGAQVPNTGGAPVSGLADPVIAPPNTLADLYKTVHPGVVSILVAVNSGGQQGEGAGSGFILSNDGYIATNYHVAGDASQIIVRFYNNVDAVGEMVGGDPDSDLAIVKVDKLPEGAVPLPLGDSNTVQVGDSVVAIGNPFGIGVSMSYGIVSGLGRTIQSLNQNYNIPLAIQTDAAINPGNSGGPLLNMRGEVIGIDAQIRTGGNGSEGNIGIGFAIPVNILKQVYPSLIQNGSYTWPYLGVGSAPADPLTQNVDNPSAATPGAVIDQVIAGGPAADGGLRDGDIVIAVDGQRVASFEDLLSYIAFKRPGDQVQLTVVRNGQQGNLTVTLGERPRGDQNNQ